MSIGEDLPRSGQLSIALQTDKRPHEYTGLAKLVEELGFDALSMYADLMYQPPIVPLTIAAQATERIRLGPAALNPLTLHPVEIAGQIATLDLVSTGRAYLGLARGAWLESLRLRQMDPIGRLTEAMDVIEQLLSGKQARYSGRHFELQATHHLRYEVERPKIPILIGSWGERLITEVASRVDEIKLGGSSNPDIIPRVRGWLDEGTRWSEKPDHKVGIVIGAVTVVDEDRARANQLIRREMALYLPVVAQLDPTVRVDADLLRRMAALVDAGDQDGAGALIPDDLVDRFSFAGTPSDIIEQCEALFQAGANRIEFGTPHGLTSDRGIKLLGEKVKPALERWRV